MNLLQPVSANCYRIPRGGSMKVDALVYLKKELLERFSEEEALKQLSNAASLPGVYNPVIGMPDIHSGFGLPIGGIMAMDAGEGLVSAGAVGMDINCGVRLLQTGINAHELDASRLKSLLKEIAQRVPAGIGKKSRHHETIKKHLTQLLTRGVPHMVNMGIGRPADLERIEERGSYPGASRKALSQAAIKRADQLSTIGGGNHFIELGFVEKIYHQNLAQSFGLQEGALTVLIHTGSRGFGHQVCQDYTRIMKEASKRMNLDIPNPGLAAAPIQSEEGQSYLEAMAAAINFAFCNRQWITEDVRKAFHSVFQVKGKGKKKRKGSADYDPALVYDVAHNIAKFEEIDEKPLLVHRKGAVRALPPHHPLNPDCYKDTGHPVIIPGSMGTSSYVVVGGTRASETFYSANHGAGRTLSRKAAKKNIEVEDFRKTMGDIQVWGGKLKSFLDEAPQAYKDVDLVVDTLAEIDVTRKVARLKPLGVIKGEGSDH